MKLNEWKSTNGSKFHILGGILSSLIAGQVIGGIMFFISALIYQIYDSLPMETSCWNHTKWDILEIGIGALFGVVIGLGIKYLLSL